VGAKVEIRNRKGGFKSTMSKNCMNQADRQTGGKHICVWGVTKNAKAWRVQAFNKAGKGEKVERERKRKYEKRDK